MMPKEDFQVGIVKNSKTTEIFYVDGSGSVYESRERPFCSVYCGFRLRRGANRSQTAEVQSSQRIKGASTGDLLSVRQDECQRSNITGLVVALVLSSVRGDPVIFNCQRFQA